MHCGFYLVCLSPCLSDRLLIYQKGALVYFYGNRTFRFLRLLHFEFVLLGITKRDIISAFYDHRGVITFTGITKKQIMGFYFKYAQTL